MTPRQVFAAAIRSSEFKLLRQNGWRLVSTERQKNNGTVALRHTLFRHTVVITTTGRVRANNFAYRYMYNGTPNEKLRRGMEAVINRSYFGTWN